MQSASDSEQARVPFSSKATTRDIFYCFRLMLGRHPNPEEWSGHAARAGEDLAGVVRSFAGSLECARRGIVAHPALHGSDTVPTETNIEGFLLYSDPADALVGAAIRAGSYEPEICALFRRHLQPGMGVIDIGANIGFFSMLAARLVGPAGLVLAVEPNPRNVRLLEASRRRNEFHCCTVVQAAAGAENGLLVLNTSYSNGTTAALPVAIYQLLRSETVQSLRLDAVWPHDRKVDFLKIDVEGAEYSALQGCETLLREHRPCLVSEFSPGLMPGISGIDGAGYLRWLVGLKYDLAVILPDGSAKRAGADVDVVMEAYASRGKDHIDIWAEPV